MIATEAKISGIDDIRKEYYDYLSTIYGEISSYLKITDGMVNSEKLELMFEKTASPFVYWREARERERKPEPGQSKTASAVAPVSGQQAAKPAVKQGEGGKLTREERERLLNVLAEKYGLQKSGEDYRLTKGLTSEGFATLRKALKDAGYVYDRDGRSFRKEAVH